MSIVVIRREGDLQLRRDETDHDRLAATAGRLGADVVGDPPRGDLVEPGARLVGQPSRGHCVAAAIRASCTASSEALKSRKRRMTAPSTCGTRLRSKRSCLVSGKTPSVIGLPSCPARTSLA